MHRVIYTDESETTKLENALQGVIQPVCMPFDDRSGAVCKRSHALGVVAGVGVCALDRRHHVSSTHKRYLDLDFHLRLFRSRRSAT